MPSLPPVMHHPPAPSPLLRSVVFLYGVVSYVIFFLTFCYAIGFVGNFIVPKSIDSSPADAFGVALAIDAALLALFAVQHSLMARPFFKRWITRFVPMLAERSTYVLCASLALIVLFWQWRPLGGVVWEIHHPLVALLLNVASAGGWLLVLVTTFLINHFDLFGLRQVWAYFRGVPYRSLHFVTPGPYKVVRHPLYFGFICAFWFTPTMTAAHLFFAVMTTVYILVAIQLEERDLEDAHPEYADYKRRIPMLVPSSSGNASAARQALD